MKERSSIYPQVLIPLSHQSSVFPPSLSGIQGSSAPKLTPHNIFLIPVTTKSPLNFPQLFPSHELDSSPLPPHCTVYIPRRCSGHKAGPPPGRCCERSWCSSGSGVESYPGRWGGRMDWRCLRPLSRGNWGSHPCSAHAAACLRCGVGGHWNERTLNGSTPAHPQPVHPTPLQGPACHMVSTPSLQNLNLSLSSVYHFNHPHPQRMLKLQGE